MVKKAERKKLSVGETWNRIIKQVGKNYKTIAKQLPNAQKQYPELVSAFKYLLGYVGYLNNRTRIRELRVPISEKQIPTPGPPDVPGHEELICGFFGESSPPCRHLNLTQLKVACMHNHLKLFIYLIANQNDARARCRFHKN